MQRLALFLAAEPLQALTPNFVMTIAPELAGKSTSTSEPVSLSIHSPTATSEPIAQIVARFGGNREAAAKHLGISRTTLWRKMKSEST